MSSMSCLSYMVCEIGDKWLYSCYFVGYCFQDLFRTACRIFVYFLSSFFSRHFVKSQMVQLNSSTDTATAWKNPHFILSERSDFYMCQYKIMSIKCTLGYDFCCYYITKYESMKKDVSYIEYTLKLELMSSYLIYFDEKLAGLKLTFNTTNFIRLTLTNYFRIYLREEDISFFSLLPLSFLLSYSLSFSFLFLPCFSSLFFSIPTFSLSFFIFPFFFLLLFFISSFVLSFFLPLFSSFSLISFLFPLFFPSFSLSFFSFSFFYPQSYISNRNW